MDYTDEYDFIEEYLGNIKKWIEMNKPIRAAQKLKTEELLNASKNWSLDHEETN